MIAIALTGLQLLAGLALSDATQLPSLGQLEALPITKTLEPLSLQERLASLDLSLDLSGLLASGLKQDLGLDLTGLNLNLALPLDLRA